MADASRRKFFGARDHTARQLSKSTDSPLRRRRPASGSARSSSRNSFCSYRRRLGRDLRQLAAGEDLPSGEADHVRTLAAAHRAPQRPRGHKSISTVDPERGTGRHTVRVHLLNPEDATSVIDGELVCAAIARLPEFEVMHTWVKRFALLADPTRLTVLLCLHHAGEICVTDLAAAAGVKDTTVSQALRLLRAHEVVTARRAGRICVLPAGRRAYRGPVGRGRPIVEPVASRRGPSLRRQSAGLIGFLAVRRRIRHETAPPGRPRRRRGRVACRQPARTVGGAHAMRRHVRPERP
jgi:ArsR family transcriptional regulator, lead/cadmium/zinc/bismuth-responsive transcriptional repressor